MNTLINFAHQLNSLPFPNELRSFLSDGGSHDDAVLDLSLYLQDHQCRLSTDNDAFDENALLAISALAVSGYQLANEYVEAYCSNTIFNPYGKMWFVNSLRNALNVDDFFLGACRTTNYNGISLFSAYAACFKDHNNAKVAKVLLDIAENPDEISRYPDTVFNFFTNYCIPKILLPHSDCHSPSIMLCVLFGRLFPV